MEGLSTAYFDEQAVRGGLSECGHEFALALHRRTGWSIGVLWRNQPRPDGRHAGEDASETPLVVHVFCVAPDLVAVDAEGACEFEAMGKRWARDTEDLARLSIEIRYNRGSYERSLHATGSAENQSLAGNEAGIQAADNLIAQSPAFLELVASLSEPAPGLGA
jgi:hypothetical protein